MLEVIRGGARSVGGKLPVHGFVLAGGKSTRMGQDKALLEFCGRPMVEIAVEKLRGFCAEVSIAGGQDSLAQYAPLVKDERQETGPAAGIEAGLRASAEPWAMFVPVDVPLVPAALLERWAREVVGAGRDEAGNLITCASYLFTRGGRAPAFCMVHRECLPALKEAAEKGVRKLEDFLDEVNRCSGAGALAVCNAAWFAPMDVRSDLTMEFWFANLNTPHDLAVAEVWAAKVEDHEAAG